MSDWQDVTLDEVPMLGRVVWGHDVFYDYSGPCQARPSTGNSDSGPYERDDDGFVLLAFVDYTGDLRANEDYFIRYWTDFDAPRFKEVKRKGQK